MGYASLALMIMLGAVAQVVTANSFNHTLPIDVLQGALVKSSIVKGAKQVVKGVVQGSMGAGAGLAAGALSGLPITAFDQYVVPAHFTRGTCSGHGYCFPKFRAAVVEKPGWRCGSSMSLNMTKLGAACIKQSFVKSTDCFKSLSCPASAKAEEVCLPTEVRRAMVGMLTVYKTHAVLPFVILPALKVALAKVLLAPVIMPKALIRSLSSGSEFNTTGHQPLYKVPELDMGDDQFNITSTKMTHPADFMKFAFEDLSMAGEGVVKALVNGSCNPLELVAKGILNVNASEVMGVIPQINQWVAAKLEGVPAAQNTSDEVNTLFPECMHRCCRPNAHKDTKLFMPSPVCSNGTTMNRMLGLCVGGEGGYSPCPDGYDRCMLPSGVPLCTAAKKVWGMDSCKMAGVLMHNLPRVQCPWGQALAYEDYNGTRRH